MQYVCRKVYRAFSFQYDDGSPKTMLRTKIGCHELSQLIFQRNFLKVSLTCSIYAYPEIMTKS